MNDVYGGRGGFLVWLGMYAEEEGGVSRWQFRIYTGGGRCMRNEGGVGREVLQRRSIKIKREESRPLGRREMFIYWSMGDLFVGRRC